MSRPPASGVTRSRDPYVGVLLMAPSYSVGGRGRRGAASASPKS